MEKKRSKGVTIFGILIILDSLFNLLGSKLSAYKFIFQPLPEKVILVCYFISVIMLIFGVISGIGILRLKNLFRKIALIFGFFGLYTYLLEGPLFTYRNGPKYLKQECINIASTAGVSESILFSIMWTIVIIFWAIEFCFFVSLIYFFNRPKVKEQFK